MAGRSALMLDPAAVEPAPWANGAGTTRELAAAFGSDGQLLWRVSVADLDRSAPFSSFPGLDRVFIPLDPVRLMVDGVPNDVLPGEELRFQGEAVAAVVVSRPTRAFNVMTLRGQCSAAVTLRSPGEPLRSEPTVTVDLGAWVADVIIISTAPAPG
jgi:hypothetical protein